MYVYTPGGLHVWYGQPPLEMHLLLLTAVHENHGTKTSFLPSACAETTRGRTAEAATLLIMQEMWVSVTGMAQKYLLRLKPLLSF